MFEEYDLRFEQIDRAWEIQSLYKNQDGEGLALVHTKVPIDATGPHKHCLWHVCRLFFSEDGESQFLRRDSSHPDAQLAGDRFHLRLTQLLGVTGMLSKARIAEMLDDA